MEDKETKIFQPIISGSQGTGTTYFSDVTEDFTKQIYNSIISGVAGSGMNFKVSLKDLLTQSDNLHPIGCSVIQGKVSSGMSTDLNKILKKSKIDE